MTTTASRLKTCAFPVLALWLVVPNAQACGELMLRSLDTMRFHAFVTHRPATIVLYDHDAHGNANAADVDKLRLALERAGHKVTVVQGADELDKAMAAHHVDVVISDSNDLAKVSSRFVKSPREPALIPLLSQNADERQVRERFPLVVSGGFRQLLRAIEQAMKAMET